MLKLMYITNNPEVAKVAEKSGVDRIFIDMEYIGKHLRQGGMDTVQSHHTIEDIINIKAVLTKSELLVRCNPIHKNTPEEIEAIIKAGADIIMLPYFKTKEEVETFINLVNKRTKTMLLVETKEAVEIIDEILNIQGIDEIHIGLNDLSLSYKMKFMFELLSNGTVEMLIHKIKNKNIPYGFGGIASLGKGMLPAEKIIAEHYRLNSTGAILSRSFCNTTVITNLDEIKNIFEEGLEDIRNFEKACLQEKIDFKQNQLELKQIVNKIINQ